MLKYIDILLDQRCNAASIPALVFLVDLVRTSHSVRKCAQTELCAVLALPTALWAHHAQGYRFITSQIITTLFVYTLY